MCDPWYTPDQQSKVNDRQHVAHYARANPCPWDNSTATLGPFMANPTQETHPQEDIQRPGVVPRPPHESMH